MKVLVLALLLVMLTGGCASQEAWETVDDALPQQVGAWQTQAYSIQVALPMGAEFVGADTEGSLYAVEDGELEIRTATFLASELNAAVKHLSGLQAERMTVVQTTRFGLPEYHFAWYAQTEEGGRVCQADLVMDGLCCYAVVTSVPEDNGKDYQQTCRQVFSSFGLSFDEGV